MKLRTLEAFFCRYETRIETRDREIDGKTESYTGPQEYTITVDTFTEAQGVWMLCPKCFRDLGGNKGCHWVDVTFRDRGVADHQGCHGTKGEPTRWEVSGTSLDDLTTKPSILLHRGCGWHGYITDGEVSIL